MLGVKSEHNAPKGKAAVTILAKLLRVQTQHLSQSDLQEIHAIKNRSKKISIIWK